MGGGIEVDSVPGAGTTFRLTVHLACAETPSAAPIVACPPGLKVMVAVSHARIRTILARQLTAAGCRLVLVDSAQQAWDDFRRHLADGTPPAALVIDQRLSDHDGAWLAAQVRGLDSPPPTLILLRHLSLAGIDVDRTLFDRLINKPAKPALLIRALAQLTQGRVPAAVSPTPAPTRPRTFAPGLRVLLADDNVVNQKVATHMLKRCGALVHCVGNGIEALQALRDADFDVVLMDCQMPEMDGYEATRQLRQSGGGCRNPQIAVIALTANALAGDREQCVAAGMNDFLSKPIDRDRLEECLLRAVPPSEQPLTAAGSITAASVDAAEASATGQRGST